MSVRLFVFSITSFEATVKKSVVVVHNVFCGRYYTVVLYHLCKCNVQYTKLSVTIIMCTVLSVYSLCTCTVFCCLCVFVGAKAFVLGINVQSNAVSVFPTALLRVGGVYKLFPSLTWHYPMYVGEGNTQEGTDYPSKTSYTYLIPLHVAKSSGVNDLSVTTQQGRREPTKRDRLFFKDLLCLSNSVRYSLHA